MSDDDTSIPKKPSISLEIQKLLDAYKLTGFDPFIEEYTVTPYNEKPILGDPKMDESPLYFSEKN